ncbi:tRNA uridine-5-carboxymethylaminomethyl(34) synthesis GTPase MnmE [Novisyntrophococcus fermenticellae]|uniref:tRNA uridine-5-carboxymethylaminomethyl(34) synthesis GTPase MnmE n=1 Tax=Novisyntrophococcus fermenticellae TaxID=2068655 RepID=UPI001E2C5D83|nr:tRNA uridine-5-carboxymethylaminomethyl(34) synthesis GTPase MnmE [Novisyntrophococcus fermenticellae]
MKSNMDTIAAISTAMAPSGIGIVRLSGKDAVCIADKIYKTPKKNKKLSEQSTHTIHYGWIKDGDTNIDEVLVMLMRGPHTYTGEDTVEIDCHGGILSVKKVLETAVKHGARPAEPGEFTKRAFLNGRIDLSQAEAVMDVISAKNEYALKSSLGQLKGSVLGRIKEIRDTLIYELAFIESALDDPEHITIDGYGEKLNVVVEEQIEKINRLLSTVDEGKLIHEGIKTVIVGKPNVGKSSILNLLVGEEKAIVTDIAGTTRDVLEENINLQGISLRMLDTAGIRDALDKVEQIGVERAREHAKDADLILYIVDASVPMDKNDEQIIELIKDKKAIVILNKSDLKCVVSIQNIKKEVDAPVLLMSAKENSGLTELQDIIKSLFFKGELIFNDEIYITNIRHKKSLEDARISLKQVKQSIDMKMPEDFFTIDLISAYESLGEITGESMGEDLINEIFSKFCTGK